MEHINAKLPTVVFSKDGCPTAESLEAIAAYDGNDVTGWLDVCADAWDQGYGAIEPSADGDRFITGGWSNNEAIIGAMSDNALMWALCWQSSHRGGMHVFLYEG